MALEKRLKSNQLLHSVYQIIGRKATCYDATTLQKNVVGHHKGTIQADSELGVGTKFIITLPIIKQ